METVIWIIVVALVVVVVVALVLLVLSMRHKRTVSGIASPPSKVPKMRINAFGA